MLLTLVKQQGIFYTYITINNTAFDIDKAFIAQWNRISTDTWLIQNQFLSVRHCFLIFIKVMVSKTIGSSGAVVFHF